MMTQANISRDSMHVLLKNVVKSQSHEIGCWNDRIALSFDRHLDSAAAAAPIIFPSDWKPPNPNLRATRLNEILH